MNAMTERTPTCPMCEQATLQPDTHTGEIEHNANRLEVRDLEFYCCPECGADPVFPDQARRNHCRFQDARRRSDGLLTGDEIVRVREALGLTQRQAADLFGGGANAFSKYERGDVIQSVAMDRLMRLIAAHPEHMSELREFPSRSGSTHRPSTQDPESALTAHNA
ncbi:MAG: type II toxin-antitoxin system MqsA family antitoxin [Candidatus Wenzhouxiangella sp. M2_3B_020]